MGICMDVVKKQINILEEDNKIIIENKYIKRVFNNNKGSITTSEIYNKVSECKINPKSGSEEFVISILCNDGNTAELKASQLTLNNISIEEIETGNKVKFIFNEINYLDSAINVEMIIEVKEESHYLRKQISVDCSNNDLVIDFIDLEHIIVDDKEDLIWSRPLCTDFNTTAFYLTLGQPVYLNSMFLGCEFPATSNQVNDENLLHIRYYCGKKIEDMKNKDKKYISWPAVIGSARSHDIEVLKSDFFKYISNISQPSRFRIQFNSWYDYMYDIAPDNIEESFTAIEKGLSKYGVRPLDSYVIDDGWNSYKEGFWEFIKDKFTDGFTKEAELTKKLNSNFGVWVGPRGGYSEAYEYARVLEKLGYGVNTKSHDICTADEKYVTDLTDRMISFMKEYRVNYWKLDGFCLRDCESKEHGHAAGGYEGMYFYCDHWEKWINAFKRMKAVDPKVFLNITSYAFPSPWFLQWTDAVWMNNAADMGFEGEGESVDQMLTYRDGRYYDFLFTRQWQFPLGYVYNHEPCYADRNINLKTNEKVVFTTEEFEKYLFVCMCRGTGFIELYYSPSMMDDEKWQVNAKVLKWAESNFHILENSKMIGGNPEKGEAYAYSAWNNGEGIIALRNPSSESKKFTFVLDKLIGATEGIKDLVKTDVYNTLNPENRTYSYGDIVEVELKPFEVAIWQLK